MLAVFAAVAVVVALGTARRATFGIAALLVIEPFDLPRIVGPAAAGCGSCARVPANLLATFVPLTDVVPAGTLFKAALLGFLVALALRRTSLAPLRAPVIRALVGGAAALVVVDALSILPALYLDAAVRETLKALEYFVAFLAAAAAYAADPDEEFIWNALAVISVLVCALALAQEVTVAPSGVFWHGRVVPRIAGPLEGPNQLAGWLDLVTPLLAARALFDRSQSGRSVRAVIFAAIATLTATTNLLTLSRSGIAAMLAGLAVVFYLAARAGHTKRLIYGLGFGVIPIAVVAAMLTFANARGGVAEFAARFGNGSEQNVDNGLATRPALWRAGLRMFAADPGLGVGVGNYELLTPTVGLVGVRTHANSVYVQALAETGVLGFAAVVWTFVAASATLLRGAREPLFGGIAAATIALAVHETYDFLTFYPKVGDLWWTLLGIGAGGIALRGLHARKSRIDTDEARIDPAAGALGPYRIGAQPS